LIAKIFLYINGIILVDRQNLRNRVAIVSKMPAKFHESGGFLPIQIVSSNITMIPCKDAEISSIAARLWQPDYRLHVFPIKPRKQLFYSLDYVLHQIFLSGKNIEI
jgi:hypothetical protein